MGKYDSMNEVKSVSDFLLKMKGQFDGLNASLPEDASKVDFETFTDSFYKANEGILKNRDLLKGEKTKLTTEMGEKTGRITELEQLTSSIDKNLPDKYNQAIEELSTLKATIKDGAVDVDVINTRHNQKITDLETDFATTLADKLSAQLTELDSFKTSSSLFQDLYNATLKEGDLLKELKRLNVNPEDTALITQAYISRADVSEDGEGGFAVFYKNDKGDLESGVEFWDKWAIIDHNQKYILAADNTGGGASPQRKPGSVNNRDVLVKAMDDAKGGVQKLTAMENLAKFDKDNR